MKTAAVVPITVNGAQQEAAAGSTLGALAQALGLDPRTVIAECNGAALRRDQWPEHPVAAGDRIEFIRIVAGG